MIVSKVHVQQVPKRYPPFAPLNCDFEGASRNPELRQHLLLIRSFSRAAGASNSREKNTPNRFGALVGNRFVPTLVAAAAVRTGAGASIDIAVGAAVRREAAGIEATTARSCPDHRHERSLRARFRKVHRIGDRRFFKAIPLESGCLEIGVVGASRGHF